MEESIPKYSSDPYLPFPATSGEIVSGLTNTRRKNVKHNQGASSSASSIPWKTTECYSCGVIG